MFRVLKYLLLTAFVSVLSFMAVPVHSAVRSIDSLDQPEWMLQLGYFSNLQNALDYKERLTEAGFEAETVPSGRPGEQDYRVIGGWADHPEEFDSLRNRIEDATGDRGFVMKNPYLQQAELQQAELQQANQVSEESAEAIFDQPHTRYLLAQAGTIQPTGGESVGSAAVSGYDTGMFRTPQENIDSMPGFTVGGINIIATLGLSLGYDDNVTRANIEEIESSFYMISPAIRAELPSDRSILALTLAADVVRYSDSEVDNREVWYLRGEWAWDPSTRQDFNLFAQYSEGANARGTGRRQGDAGLLPIPLDEWKRTDIGGIWRYGAIGARGKLDVMLGGSDLEYTNNREGTELLDRDWQYIGTTFYWRVAPKTALLADLRYTDINYDVSDHDSEETSWMLGATWDASARTSGRVSYGNQKKTFANPDMENYDGPTWLASVSWRPRSWSMFTLTGSRSTQEPDGNGDFVLRQDISLAWIHDWATRFGTVVDVGYGEDDYRPHGRTDNLFYWSVAARYMLNRHFRFGASIQGYDRDSEIEEFNFTRNVYMLTLEASF